MKSKLTIIALLIALCVSLYFARPGVHAAPAPPTWEYKVQIKKCNDEKILNALGAEGWELTTYSQWPVAMSTVDTCVFKRPK
jgi:hypothetical protein